MVVEVQRVSKSAFKLAIAIAVTAFAHNLAPRINQRAARAATSATDTIIHDDKALRFALHDFDPFACLDEFKALFGA